MKTKMTLENLSEFSIPLSDHPLKWKFESEDTDELFNEFEDQIIALNSEASKFLWNFESTQRYLHSLQDLEKHFNQHSELSFKENENKKVKKWLYHKDIPFNQKVFWSHQPDTAFILTWKMVIKFSENLFFSSDEIIWDKTLNWVLICDHNDIIYFAQNRIFNADKHSEEKIQIKNAIDEINKKNVNQ
ncbi:hypothetical protein [Chryseobacterium scophthalmum]|uniref:hypothetical protein n=1 Tax=Chryseobacterium scophthalmum TaxID=59733 RepID=UPI001AEBC3EB|nr:hypothetical protein [Chryseobacterium scophthalmum]